jgi:hypothetical protein
VPDGGRRGAAACVVVVRPDHDVELEAAGVDVEDAGATVLVATVPVSAVLLPHDARRTLAPTMAVTAIPFLIVPIVPLTLRQLGASRFAGSWTYSRSLSHD